MATTIHSSPIRPETSFQNVHSYDRKLEYRQEIPRYPHDIKESLFQKVQSLLNPDASLMIQEIRQGGNYDSINMYDASDILYHLLINSQGDTQDMYKNLNEQLADMYKLGKCPQGRVIRLLSLVNAFCSSSSETQSQETRSQETRSQET